MRAELTRKEAAKLTCPTVKGLPGERLRQAFHHFDKEKTGYIRPDEFARIIREMAQHKLSDALLTRLTTLCTLSAGGKISYSEVIAFHNIITGMDSIERIVKHAISKSKDGRIDRADFLNSAAQTTRYSNYTPLEAKIIFHFAGMGLGTQRLAYKDFGALINPIWERPEEITVGSEVPQGKTFLQDLARSAYNFGLGGIAGGLGATAVYPIDLTSKWRAKFSGSHTDTQSQRRACKISDQRLSESCYTRTASMHSGRSTKMRAS